MMEITKNLRERRKDLGLSQMQLAEKVGVCLLTIQLWERGAGYPNEVNQEKLRRALHELEGNRPSTSQRKGKSTIT